MKLSFRWYGKEDPVSLEKIRQIPVVKGIVSALYHIPVGDVWPSADILELKSEIESHGLELTAIESVPVHESIKLGDHDRDIWIDKYCENIKNIGEAGIGVICYNFMPVFDWTRSTLNMELPDHSTCLAYDHELIKDIDLRKDDMSLPGWSTSYERKDLIALLETYKDIDEEKLWSNLEYFLKKIIPIAETYNVRMGIHPDDPPWPIFNLPRIIKNERDMDRLLSIMDSRSNGLTLCTGSLGADAHNDVVKLIDKYAAMDRIVFAHIRNIALTGEQSFHETAVPGSCGDIDITSIIKIYKKHGFNGVIRPDHGRMICGETGRPGYGLYDRALSAMYLAGLWDGIEK